MPSKVSTSSWRCARAWRTRCLFVVLVAVRRADLRWASASCAAGSALRLRVASLAVGSALRLHVAYLAAGSAMRLRVASLVAGSAKRLRSASLRSLLRHHAGVCTMPRAFLEKPETIGAGAGSVGAGPSFRLRYLRSRVDSCPGCTRVPGVPGKTR